MNDFTQHMKEDEERLMEDLRALAADVQALLRHAAQDAGDGWDEARQHLEERVKAAREQVASLEEALRGGPERAAGAALAWAREHPWQLLGAGVGLGVLLALLLRDGKD